MYLTYDHYYGYEELTTSLETMVAKHSGIAAMRAIGVSAEGRDIWSVTITNAATGADTAKPAIYIDGNHHAGELVGSMVALYTVDYLLSNYGRCGQVTRLVDTVAFYVLPRVSPDGAERYLTTPETLRSVPRYYPFAEWEEMEGLYPADVDGDGQILLMRVKDPAGEWKVSALDSRAMAVRRPEEQGGEYYRVLPEGFIRNYDGVQVKSATAKFGIDLNRNFPNDWVVEGQQAGSGPYPLSERESRALAEFVTAHPNIAVGISHHTTGGAILVPPGSRDPRTMPARDMEAFKAVGDLGEEITGFPNVPLFSGFHVEKGKFNRGAYDEWLYLHRGIISITSELWNIAVRAGVKMWPRTAKTHAEQEQDAVKVLRFNDQELQGEAFEEWRPFEHPQLGVVEIGGWKGKWAVTNAPVKFLAAECHKVARWGVAVAETLPHLEVRGVQVRRVGGGVGAEGAGAGGGAADGGSEGLYQVSCGVYSTGYLPTSGSDYALELKMDLPFEVWLEGGGGGAGGAGDSSDTTGVEIIGKTKHKLEHLPGRCGAGGLSHGFVPGPRTPREIKLSWLVQARDGARVRIVAATPRAGTAQCEFAVRETS